MRILIQFAPISAVLAVLTGCASIVNGTHETIAVSTFEVTKADCLLSNSKGQWEVKETPGKVSVHRDNQNLFIECKKRGYFPAKKSVPAAFNNMAMGNVVLGGLVGLGVDANTKASYSYPQQVEIPMHKKQ